MADRRRTKRRATIGAVVLVVVLGVATSAWALAGGSSAAYRTTTVVRGAVAQTLTATGTISPVHDADLDFQVAGEVSNIYAKQGSRVHAGQRLAALDRATLRSALRMARSTVTAARAQLVDDETSQSSAASSSSSPSPSTPTSPSQPSPTTSPKSAPSPTPSGGSNPVTKQLIAKIRRDQAAVINAQQQADADLATAKSALSAETTACADELAGSGDADDSTSTAACVAAIQTLLADQQTVAAVQQAVSKAETTLTNDLSAAGAAITAAPSVPSGNEDTVYSDSSTDAVRAAAAVATTVPAGAVTTQVDDSLGGATVTAATLASDQAKIDASRAGVATARADLTQATLRSPINGKVAAVTITKGSRASGSSSSTSPAFKIVGSRQTKVTVGVAAAQVRRLTPGMSASVVPDGASTALHGAVAQIGQATTDATSGDTTYPVTITLSTRPTNLVSGADAQVSITLSQRSNVIVVPTSAVHRTSTMSYVETDAGGSLKRVKVVVGAVGAAVTQIKSGLAIGEQVVLADLNAAVPSSSTNLLNNRGGIGSTTFTRVGGSGGPPTFSGPPGGATAGGGG